MKNGGRLGETSSAATQELHRLLKFVSVDEELIVERERQHAAHTPASPRVIPHSPAAAGSCSLPTLLNGLYDCRLPNSDDDGRSRRYGREQAAKGASVLDIVQESRLTYQLTQRRATEITLRGGFSDSVLLALLEFLNIWFDQCLASAMAGHREGEHEILRGQQASRANLVRRILTSREPVPEWELHRLAIDIDRPYFAVRARPSGRIDSARIERELFGHEGSSSGATIIDGDVCGVVANVPNGPAAIVIGVSHAVGLSDLTKAFKEATVALETAIAAGRDGVVDIGSLGLQPAVLSNHDIAATLHDRYIQAVERQSQRGDTILDTVEAYLDANCRLDVAARTLWVHVNTVRYRIARFEEFTQCSLHDTEALVEVWWVLRRRRLRPNPAELRPVSTGSAAPASNRPHPRRVAS